MPKVSYIVLCFGQIPRLDYCTVIYPTYARGMILDKSVDISVVGPNSEPMF